MTRLLTALAICAALSSTALAEERRPMNVEDMLDLRMPSGIAISPDGETLAYVLSKRDFETNKNSTKIRLLDLKSKAERPFTGAGGDHEGAPAWSPDGKLLAFTSDKSGTGQIWLTPAKAAVEVKQLTDFVMGASSPRWLFDAKTLLFMSRVYPGCGEDSACNEKRLKADKDDPVKASVFTKLMYRHWDHWRDGRISHLHLVGLEWSSMIIDLMPEDKWGVTGDWDIFAEDDGGVLVYATKNPKDEALHTNNDIFTVDLGERTGDGPKPGIPLTADNPAWDAHPVLSPDGKQVLYLAHKKAGFESDRTWLTLRDSLDPAAAPRSLAEGMDYWLRELGWFPDGKEIWFTAMVEGRVVLYALKLDDLDARPRVVADRAAYSSVTLTPDGKRFVFVRQTLTEPPEIWTIKANGKGLKRLTFNNKPIEDRVDFAEVEDVWWEGADGDKVHGFLLFPPGTSKDKKNPFLLLIHGGPQGMWTDAFHPRWNAQLFAAPGYVTLLPNPRGSSGYGQEFTNEISRDWGGRCYEDLMKGVDHLIAKGWVDPDRMAAGGGSFGGYMANWILGKNERFKCLFSHAGVYDLVSMYGSTEELWFPDWEYGGPPWEAPGDYERFSPSRLVKNFKTPMLVIHGANDFRVPLNQAMQLFTALQRMGVPSRFLYYPDESHFVVKPKNTKLWYDEIHGWLGTWL